MHKEYWDQMATLTGDRAVLDPNDKRGAKNNYIRYSIHKNVAQALKGLANNSSVLEFGCGTGANERFIAALGFYYVGVDISYKLLATYGTEIQANSQSTLLQYDGLRLPFKSGCFDAIFTNGVLQHITDDSVLAKVLKELARVITLNGRMIFIEQTYHASRYVDNNTKKQRELYGLIDTFEKAGMVVVKQRIIRRGHSLLTYAVRYGFVPKWLFGFVLSLESFIGKLFPTTRFDYTVRYFELSKPAI